MNRFQWLRYSLGALAAALCLQACSPSGQQPPRPAASAKPTIVATTGMVADLVRQVMMDDAEVICLLGPTVDPHSYSPSPSDVKALQKADIIVANGLRLEGKMEETFINLRKQGRNVIILGEGIPPESLLTEDYGAAKVYDPHIWGDLTIWSKAVDSYVKQITKLKPLMVSTLESRAVTYQTALQKAHAEMKAQVKRIPQEQRVLVTSHDAFQYFGRAYGFTVRGAQGLSTATEAGIRDMVELTNFIKERKLKAIFVESSVQPGLIERLSKDTGAVIGGKLYSDALGAPGEEVQLPDWTIMKKDTVLGMQWSNMLTVLSALE
jgi:manganese/zinc/iron transport system substrate-binding protein